MNKTILFVDNNQDFLDVYTRILEKRGFHVLPATSIEAAQSLLETHLIHVTILDIRTRNDQDSADTSGLEFAKDLVDLHIPVIVVTAYPSFSYLRTVFGMAQDTLDKAAYFVDKAECPDALLAAVTTAFERHVQINWDLRMFWEHGLSLAQLADRTDPVAANIQWATTIAQIDNLLRGIFYDKQQITINSIQSNQAGYAIADVTAFRHTGAEEHYVVSCGLREIIEDERMRFAEFAPQHAAVGLTRCADCYQNQRFAANAYTLFDRHVEHAVSFAHFYQVEQTAGIDHCLNQLFKTTLAVWHTQKISSESGEWLDQSFTTWLGLGHIHWDAQITGICEETMTLVPLTCTGNSLRMVATDGQQHTFVHPIPAPDQLKLFATYRLLCGASHGSVTPHAILVDQRQHAWLIDFRRAGYGPLLRDFVLLEAWVLLELLETESPTAFLSFLQRVTTTEFLDAAISCEECPPAYHKALHTIENIRKYAAGIVGQAIEPYLAGLYYCLLHWVAAFQPGRRYAQRRLMPYVCALLGSAVIRQHLEGQLHANIPSTNGVEGLRIVQADKELQVWLAGKRVGLSIQEEKILAHLYQNLGQLCMRKELIIATGEVGSQFDLRDEEGRLYTAITRLRQKIEPNPKKPSYLITVPGRGYSLVLPSHSAPM